MKQETMKQSYTEPLTLVSVAETMAFICASTLHLFNQVEVDEEVTEAEAYIDFDFLD